MTSTMIKSRTLFKMYQNALNRRPYLIQGLQTGVLMGAGDLIAQTVIEKRKASSIDINRTLQFSSIGLFFGGPALRVWYGVLEKFIGSKTKGATIKKVVVDQVVFAPVFLFAFLSVLGVMQRKTLEEIKQKLETNYISILQANYFVWPMVQLVNFSYVPLQYQVLVVQVVALFWNSYLSWKANSESEPAKLLEK